MPHKDQTRIKSSLLPHLMDRVFEDSPSAVTDCTALNRCFLQGADPLYLQLVCPTQFDALCGLLSLDPVSGRDAIESAHVRGPGVLLGDPRGVLDETGIPSDYMGSIEAMPDAWKREALWLILAALSDTTEEDYKPDITILERLQRATSACIGLSVLVAQYTQRGTVTTVALQALKDFQARCHWTPDEGGIPVCAEDAGFYIAYKAGHRVAGVSHGDKVFYGCIPGITLDSVGIKVDVKVSESYGFRRIVKE